MATGRRVLWAAATAHPDAGPWDLSGRDLTAWLTGRAPATQRCYHHALAGFYAWACETGLTDTDPTRIVTRAPAPPPHPRPVRDADYAAALALAPTWRERLMVRLAGELGLRRAEVAAVHVDDLRQADDGWWLTVHGKGERDRDMPCTDELAAAIAVASEGAGWVFAGRSGGHLTPGAVGKVVGRLLPAGVGMHALRHRFATRAYDLERDACAVQELLGHARAATTRMYVQTTAGSMRRTVEALDRAR